MHTTQITTDFAADTIAEAIDSLAALVEHVPGLSWSLAEAQGPAGWPLVTFSVPNEGLDRFMALYEG